MMAEWQENRKLLRIDIQDVKMPVYPESMYARSGGFCLSVSTVTLPQVHHRT